MEGDHQLMRLPEGVEGAAHGVQRRLLVESEQGGAGHLPHAEDELRVHQLDLLVQIGEAAAALLGQGVAVVRRTMLEDVRDVDIFTAEFDRFEDVGEELARLAHEGLALEVLVLAGGLANEHEIGIGVSDAENEVRARQVGAKLLRRFAHEAELIQGGDGRQARSLGKLGFGFGRGRGRLEIHGSVQILGFVQEGFDPVAEGGGHGVKVRKGLFKKRRLNMAQEGQFDYVNSESSRFN